MGGLIGSRLTAPYLRETSPILPPVHFAPFPHTYVSSLAPLLLTLPAFAFSALNLLLRTESTGEKKGEGGGREGGSEPYRRSHIPTALMGGGAVIIQADPCAPSDVSVEML